MVPSGDSPISEPMQVAVDTAVMRINDAGGVLGRSVQVVIAEEGETAASLANAVQKLVDADVDAIIGPASSLVALGSLDEIASAGKLACSPTASAMALDNFPDNGLFFRTVPSDSLQAQAIAQAADKTGAQRAAVVYVDDAYGRGFAEAVRDALQPGAITVVDAIPFRAADDLGDEVSRLIASDAQVAIVLANGDDGTLFLSELDTVDNDGISHVFVNDAMRNPLTPQRIADLDPTFRAKIVGLAPQAESDDPAVPFDPPGPFAANAYDCVNLIALAAIVAGSDAPRAIADHMSLVSSSGSACRTFALCVAETEKGLQINYDGPSGLTEIQARQGDPARAIFDRFAYDEMGTDVLLGTVIPNS
jgi:branched-chain amino acid transport system substrate-binding protein